MRIPQWAKDLGQSPSSFEKKREVKNVEQSLCAKCNGIGKISKRCQCGGTGKTLDRKATELQGVPVYKECKRCEGRGYSRPKSSVAYRGIFSELPSLLIAPGVTAGSHSTKCLFLAAFRKRAIQTPN
jgi:hypothetical protein